MKIFILAFCIFQISLAKNYPKVYDKGDNIEAANQQLVAQVRSVINKNGKIFSVGDVYAYHYLTVVTKPLFLREDSGIKVETILTINGFLAEMFMQAKIVTDGAQAAGIALKTIDAYASFNIYADVINNLNELAKKKGGVTPTAISTVDFPKNLNVVKITVEAYLEMYRGYEKMINAAERLFIYESLFTNYYSTSGHLITINYLNAFLKNIFGYLVMFIDPVAAYYTASSIATLEKQFDDVVAEIVNNGTPIAEVMWKTIIFGLQSTVSSYYNMIQFIKEFQEIAI